MVLAWAKQQQGDRFEMVLDGFDILEPSQTPGVSQQTRATTSIHGTKTECALVDGALWVIVGWDGDEWRVSTKLPPAPRIGADSDISARKGHGQLITMAAYRKYLKGLEKDFQNGGGVKAYIG